MLLSAEGTTLIQYLGNDTSVTVPEGVEEIEKGAFRECENLASIHLPEGLERIADWAFKGCGKLNSIRIPDSVEGIYGHDFEGCDSLRRIEISADTKVYDAEQFPENCEIVRRSPKPASAENEEGEYDSKR